MDNRNTKSDIINVLVKKQKNSYITVLSNIPQYRINDILNVCRTKFGCGGNILKDAAIPSISLQGNQKFNIEKNKESIFKGLDVNFDDKNKF